MADSLDIKRLKAELAGVTAAKLQFDLRIEERLDEIIRIKSQVEVQEAKEKELEARIAELQKA